MSLSDTSRLIVFRRKSDMAQDGGRVVGCYGVGCEHGTCLRYTAIEHLDANTFCMGHCPLKADGTRSMYVPDRKALLREVQPLERRHA